LPETDAAIGGFSSLWSRSERLRETCVANFNHLCGGFQPQESSQSQSWGIAFWWLPTGARPTGLHSM